MQTAVEELAAARAQLDGARERLIAAMLRARREGMSFREIGRLAGLSHETVRTMLRDRDVA